MNSDFYRFQLGNYECVTLYDGYHDYKLEQMVTNAPQTAIEAALRAHGFVLYPKNCTQKSCFLYNSCGYFICARAR